MARHQMVLAIGILTAAPAVATAGPAPVQASAPAGDATTRYCLRIEAVTGSRLEEVKCWTRAEWAAQEVDVDKEWAKEGVGVIA